MTELFKPNIDDQIACAVRELNMRRAVYPRQVANKRMSQKTADREIAAQEAIIETLTNVRDREFAEKRQNALHAARVSARDPPA